MNEILYSSADLLKFMGEHGLPKSRMWLRWTEGKQKITCMRMPNGRKDRKFTYGQMEEIVQAFSPEGSGEWHYV